MRREFLKGYLLALFFEGEFKGVSSIPAATKKALALIAADVPAVLGEIATAAAEQAAGKAEAVAAQVVQKAGTSISGWVENIAQDISKRGLGQVWGDLRALYDRGVEANATPRAKK